MQLRGSGCGLCSLQSIPLGAYTLQSDCSGSTNMSRVLPQSNCKMRKVSTYSSKKRTSVRVSAAITMTGRAADAPESCEQLCSITRSLSVEAAEEKPAARMFTNRVQRTHIQLHLTRRPCHVLKDVKNTTFLTAILPQLVAQLMLDVAAQKCDHFHRTQRLRGEQHTANGDSDAAAATRSGSDRCSHETHRGRRLNAGRVLPRELMKRRARLLRTCQCRQNVNDGNIESWETCDAGGSSLFEWEEGVTNA